jgi:hypothetical protein
MKQEAKHKYATLPESQKPSAVLLLLYYKETVPVIVPFLSAYPSTESGRHSHHRCFL